MSKADRQAIFLKALRESGGLVRVAAEVCGIPAETYHSWRYQEEGFKQRADRVKEEARIEKKSREGTQHVYDPNRRTRKVPNLAEFRWDYLGRPTLPHQEPVVAAWEDRTNRVVKVLGPPGSGKDTIAGDISLWESVRAQQRVAWIMESSEFSVRRLGRMTPYLTNPRSYEVIPDGPGCQKPTRSLIEDFGPFRWAKDLRYPDGLPVPKLPWTQNASYFVGRSLEADPNIWATGLQGSLYGARIDTAVTSDIFTQENQISPVVMNAQMEWVFGTFYTRLDEKGRWLDLGTRVSGRDNHGRMVARLAADSPVIVKDGWMTKYANGFTTVIYPAIQLEDDVEVSYWEDRFPLKSWFLIDNRRIRIPEDPDEHMRLAKEGAQIIEGLVAARNRDPGLFATMYQQQPPEELTGDFTELLLDKCDDEDRVLGQYRAGRELVLGIDPARKAGAAWVLWEWDHGEEVAYVVDFFIGSQLGIRGIREKLLVDPVTKYWPRYAAYEINREESALEHPDVINAVAGSGTEIVKHFTAKNRNVGDTRVAMMSEWMRRGKIRFPSATPKCRQRMRRLKQHFLNWDSRQQMGPATVRARSTEPDDGCMAAWVGWITITERLAPKQRAIVTGRDVSQITKDRWGHRSKAASAKVMAPVSDIVEAWYGAPDG